jgi:hypothetical protein
MLCYVVVEPSGASAGSSGSTAETTNNVVEMLLGKLRLGDGWDDPAIKVETTPAHADLPSAPISAAPSSSNDANASGKMVDLGHVTEDF